jgi:hypothetical protein
MAWVGVAETSADVKWIIAWLPMHEYLTDSQGLSSIHFRNIEKMNNEN